jgi:hypothetical protein
MDVPADSHLPQTLQRDPLTSDDLGYGEDDNRQQTMKDLELFRRLQSGLTEHNLLGGGSGMHSPASVATPLEKSDSSDNFGKYSHHLGRAEFGTLTRRASSSTKLQQAAAAAVAGGDERPASATGFMSSLAAPSLSNRTKKQSFSSQASQGRDDDSLELNALCRDEDNLLFFHYFMLQRCQMNFFKSVRSDVKIRQNPPSRIDQIIRQISARNWDDCRPFFTLRVVFVGILVAQGKYLYLKKKNDNFFLF